MTEDLRQSLERLRLRAETPNSADDMAIDEILELPRKSPRIRKTKDEIKKEVEERFLTPPTSFGPEWLDRLQQ